jgi:hypothetical protein
MDKLAVSPAELFLQIALTSTNRNTRKRVPHLALILTHRDAAAAVSLAKPATLMTSISRCCYRRDLFELGHSLVALTFFGDPITWGRWATGPLVFDPLLVHDYPIAILWRSIDV